MIEIYFQNIFKISMFSNMNSILKYFITTLEPTRALILDVSLKRAENLSRIPREKFPGFSLSWFSSDLR